MTDAFDKLFEAAKLVGLTVSKTPGNRYRFDDAQGTTVNVAGNLDGAIELIRLHGKAQAKRVKADAPKADKTPRSQAPKAGQPIAKKLAAHYEALPNGLDRARVLREAQDTYGRQAVIDQLGISTANLSRQLASLQLVETSKVISKALEGGQLSWAKIHSQLATKMRHGLQEQERIAANMIQEALELAGNRQPAAV